jgi:hypothetical protein
MRISKKANKKQTKAIISRMETKTRAKDGKIGSKIPKEAKNFTNKV